MASWDSERGLILMCVLLEPEGEEITPTVLAQPKDKEGLNQGKESGPCLASFAEIARNGSINKWTLNALNWIAETRILLL